MAGNREGAIKRAAARLGMTLEAYQARAGGGEKHCTRCRAWHPTGDFGVDASRYDGLAAACSRGRKTLYTLTYVPLGGHEPRDGDKLQARARTGARIRSGQLPRASEVPCVDCEHLGDDRRHEYDHYLGYAAEHHEDVQVRCKRCHTRVERMRRDGAN